MPAFKTRCLPRCRASSRASPAMNAVPGQSGCAGETGPQRRGQGWPRRWLAAHRVRFRRACRVSFLRLAQKKRNCPARRINRVPSADTGGRGDSDEWLALNNPTLFALPNRTDFASAFVVAQLPRAVSASFDWTEPPRWLLLPAENLGATFSTILCRQTILPAFLVEFQACRRNWPSRFCRLNPHSRQNSTLQIEGDLRAANAQPHEADRHCRMRT
jgi:hypothetical protein